MMHRKVFKGLGQVLRNVYGPPFEREDDAGVVVCEDPSEAVGALRASARHLKRVAQAATPKTQILEMRETGEEKGTDPFERGMRHLLEQLREA